MEAVDKLGMAAAIEQAKNSYAEGGIPIGSALVYHGLAGEEPKLIAAGHNERIQKASPTLHGEISALENAGRLKPDIYRKSTIVSSLGSGILLVKSVDAGSTRVCEQFTTLRCVVLNILGRSC